MISLNIYPNRKETEIEWLGEIPVHWSLKKLKHVSQINTEALSEATSPDYSLQYIDISNVDEVNGIGNIQEMVFKNAPSRARRIVKAGDTIISTVRTYLKAVAYFEDPPKNLIVSTGFAVLHPLPCIYPKFLKWLVLSQEFVERVITHSTGIGYPAINPSELANLPIWLPPLLEQQAIADFLDRETARIDALIEKYQRMMALLEEKRTSLISRAVTQGLDLSRPQKETGLPWLQRIPVDWSIVRNGNLFFERDERNRPDLPLLYVSIHTGVTLREFSGEHIEQMASDWTTYKVAKCGDITFNKMRMWQGAVGVAPVDGLVSPDYTVACPKKMVNAKYFEYLFRTENYKNEINRFSHGIVPDRNRLYWEQFKQLPSVCPSYEEQSRIVDFINTNNKKINGLIEKITRMISNLMEYRSALISAAVTGKINVMP